MAGPSGKTQTKLPAPLAALKIVVPDWRPVRSAADGHNGEGVLAGVVGEEVVGGG